MEPRSKAAMHVDWRVLPQVKSQDPHVDSSVWFLLGCLARHGGGGQKTEDPSLFSKGLAAHLAYNIFSKHMSRI